ncbi:cytochrome B [Parasulfuritortus cantonensis]|uniref:Cytochrome B n=1 Tax=Parasulfuritortus cantonensis TaxID=2528202 RepID=A0A4R1BF38_9PROT|nr:cytochrome b/b6 domain-containing protein [Parasulfuritortus cantonensis]TCJ15796.1 cytochrome B [Parasulfuritortus cantonensis]
MERVLVWDWPTRIGHWLMALAFLVAYLTGESEEWRLVHVWAGGALAGLVAFRLFWGLVGTRHARFADFVRAPKAAWHYLTGLAGGRAEHYTGHNPAGAYAILALLGLGLAAAATGWPTYQDIGGEWLEELHEGVVNAMLAVVVVHLAGVLVGSLAHRENLPRAMVTGLKLGRRDEAIAGAALWAVPLLLVLALSCAWWLSL